METLGHAAIRGELQRRPLIPYEGLEAMPIRPTTGQVNRMLIDGWTQHSNTIPLKPPINWTHPNRSFEFYIHSWEPITYLLPGFENHQDERCFQAALDYSLNWLVTYQDPLLSKEREPALDCAQTHPEPSAWYDMGVGRRAYRAAYLADVVARRGDHDLDTFSKLFDATRFHLDLLARDSFFVGRNNHGLYQALGQLAAARRFRFLPDFEKDYQQATVRLRTMFDRSFFDSGVHREHSPGYHFMILGSFLGARTSGLLTEDMDERLGHAENALGWMIGPKGALANIGDTDYKPHRYRPEALAHYKDPHVRYSLSGGQTGDPAPDGVRGYYDAGAAFIRSGETYLAQTAAFHSRTHKHSDHFSFLWWEGGEEVLIDPGRFGYTGKTAPDSQEFEQGYWYADPRRMYVERTRAHNCVEIDGRDYPRNKVSPFGSALRLAEQQDDLFVTTCETYHFRRIRHRRDLILRPGHFLIVLDWLYDRAGHEYDYRQWFQLAPQWDQARAASGGAGFVSPSGKRLWVANLLDPAAEPVQHRGEHEPEMSGWRSDKAESLVPTTSLHFSDRGHRGAFATLLLLGDGEATQATRLNQSLSTGRLQWTQGGAEQSVVLSRSGTSTRAAFVAEQQG